MNEISKTSLSTPLLLYIKNPLLIRNVPIDIRAVHEGGSECNGARALKIENFAWKNGMEKFLREHYHAQLLAVKCMLKNFPRCFT